MHKFDGINTPEGMQDYLRDVLSRSDEETCLFHYTTISKVMSIVETGYLWLGDYRWMNDPFEAGILNEYRNAGHLFFTSFSRARESLAMYRMYCGNKSEASVILKLPVRVLVSMMTAAYHGEAAGGIDDDGKYCQYFRKLNVVKNDTNETKGTVSDELVEASVFAADVAYYDPYSHKIHFGGEENSNILKPLNEENLAGWLKYKCWDYEQEVRLFAYTDKELNTGECVAVKLPDDFFRHSELILGPGFDKEKYREELVELRKQGINSTDSIYEMFYSDLAKEFVGRPGRLGMDKGSYYEGKTFSGLDPWGDKLSLEVISCEKNWLKCRFTNVVKENDSHITIGKEFKALLEDGLFIRFNVLRKVTIDEDPSSYLKYEYEGVILFVGDKVTVTYGDGQCYSHVLGGAGAECYHYTGAWRMAEMGKSCELKEC